MGGVYKTKGQENLMTRSVHYSSQRVDWKTPRAVYQILDAEFRFDHDPCPGGILNWETHGLSADWGKCNFVNPPYGAALPRWMEKGYQEYLKGKVVVFLVPSRTDTRWWHDFCMKATEIRFVKGRLKFDDQKNSAPFPSAIIIFK